MSAAPNRPDGPLRIGLVAPAGDWPAFAAVASDSGAALVAVHGSGSPPPEGATRYDDARAMLAQAQPHAVVIHGSVRVGVEVGILAFERGVHVLRSGPLARSFAEGADLLRRAREARVVCRITSWWDRVDSELRALARGFDARASYCDLHVSEPGPPLNSWRSSLVDAGGGSATTSAAALLEALLALRGLPESVLAGVVRCRRPPGLAPRETEDVAAALLRFEGGGLASVRALWDQPPTAESLLLHTPEQTLRIEREAASLSDAAGNLLERRALPVALLADELRSLSAWLELGAEHDELRSHQERQLALCALLESIYLAARTGHPEQPRKLYEVHRWPEFRR